MIRLWDGENFIEKEQVSAEEKFKGNCRFQLLAKARSSVYGEGLGYDLGQSEVGGVYQFHGRLLPRTVISCFIHRLIRTFIRGLSASCRNAVLPKFSTFFQKIPPPPKFAQ